MNARTILNDVITAKNTFGAPCGKYSGALTVEVIRSALEREGIRVSPRDVFIHGVLIEIDLVVPGRDAKPSNGLLYEPSDVLAVIEIKNAGSFGAKSIQKVRENFQQVSRANPGIRCCYPTLAERKGFKDAVTSLNSGGEAYTLFWHSGSGKNLMHEPTNDWDRFIDDMRTIQEKRGAATAD